MKEENIWENLDLSENKLKTAYSYLSSQADNFKNAVKGELSMEVEVSQVTSGGPEKRKMTLYTLLIIAPHLGNFRKKILHIAEFNDVGRFPVNIWDYLNERSVKNIKEADLLHTLKQILATTKIKNVIENLYIQSIEAKNDK